MSKIVQIGDSKSEQEIAQNLDSVGWGAFFVWAGIAFLADIGWGPGLIGIGVIMFAVQAGRAYFDLRLDWFALLLATVLALSGIARWLELSPATMPLPAFTFPLLFIGVGFAILFSAWRHWRHD